MPQTPLFGSAAFVKDMARPEFPKPSSERPRSDFGPGRPAFNDALSTAQTVSYTHLTLPTNREV